MTCKRLVGLVDFLGNIQQTYKQANEKLRLIEFTSFTNDKITALNELRRKFTMHQDIKRLSHVGPASALSI
jgi:hypothetical protein